MNKQYGTAEVQALLAQPAKIACVRTVTGEDYNASDIQQIVLLQNHNVLVIFANRYTILTSAAVESITMEVERAEQEDTVSSIS